MSEGFVKNKKELRKELINLRNSVENRTEKSENIQNILCEQDFYKSSKNVMIYSGINSEVSTDLLIDKIFSDNKTAVFPKCKENFRMSAIEVKSKNDLEKKAYGILEPISDKAFSKDKIDLIIVPAIAYDTDRNRLGYGAGYYDRFLADFKGVKVGLCFRELLIFKKLPISKYDIKVDIIITDDGIY